MAGNEMREHPHLGISGVDSGGRSRRKVVIVIVIALLAILACGGVALFLVGTETAGNNVMTNASDNNANTDEDLAAANAGTQGTSSTSTYEIGSNNANQEGQDASSSQSSNGSPWSGNGNLTDDTGNPLPMPPSDSVPYYIDGENESDSTPTGDSSTSIDWSQIPMEEKNDADTMDRDRLKSIASDFIPTYFSTKGNGGTRAQKLMDYLDIDYINKQKYSSSLYNDIILNDGIGGFVVPQKSQFISMGDVTIDNAQAPNAVVRVSVTYKAPAGGEDGAPVTEQERTQTVKIYFNENYKIKEVKYA